MKHTFIKLPYFILLMVFLGWNPCSAIAQSESASQINTDTLQLQAQYSDSVLIQKMDSILNERFARLDSLAQNLAGTTAEQHTAQGDSAQFEGPEQAIAQLDQLISWTKVLLIVLFFIATYYLTIFISKILDNLSEKVSKYRLRIKRMIPILRVLLWSFAFYIAIAGIIQPPYATIVTVLASVGIAVGLASQDVLKNLFGGVMLILDRPFQVGDKIQFAEHYGEVQQIGLRSSRIVTPGDSVVTIPNGELIRTSVSNANSGALDCQVITEIYLPADAPVEEVKEIAYKAVVSSRFVFLKKPISIMTQNEMHERRFVLKLKVKAYVLDIRYEFPFQSDVTELILTELRKRDIIRDEAKMLDLKED